jgi:hypothetical protein
VIKLITCLALYAAAMFLIYTGLNLAPEMTWPKTDLELAAASMLVMGSIAKLAGHIILLSFGKAR